MVLDIMGFKSLGIRRFYTFGTWEFVDLGIYSYVWNSRNLGIKGYTSFGVEDLGVRGRFWRFRDLGI